MLVRYDELFADCPELTGIFFPGGDPGANLVGELQGGLER
jgi:hypothetical protein